MSQGIVCIDIGGTEIKYGWMDEDEQLHSAGKIPSEAHKGGPGLKDKVSLILSQLIKEYVVKGVAISTAGMVDPITGVITYAGPQIPDYIGMDWKLFIEEKFSLPCSVENDVNCAGLAEATSGAAKNCRSSICLTIGTGIGGALILDEKVYHGFSGSAMEIGYMHQNQKTFQENASTTSLIERFTNRQSPLHGETNGKEIFQLAKEGNEEAIKEIDELLYYLAEGIANLCYVLNPEMVVLGGGIMEQTEYLQPKIEKLLEEKLIPKVYKDTKIAFALHKNHAGMIGAYYNYKQSMM